MTDSFGKRYLDGWAALLVERATGDVRFRRADSPPGPEVPLFFMAAPDQPDVSLTLAYTVLRAGGSLSTSLYQLQLRSRGTPDGDDTTCTAIDDAAQDLLLGIWDVVLPTGVHVETSELTGSTSLGADGSNRWHWASNYSQNVYRPGPNRM